MYFYFGFVIRDIVRKDFLQPSEFKYLLQCRIMDNVAGTVTGVFGAIVLPGIVIHVTGTFTKITLTASKPLEFLNEAVDTIFHTAEQVGYFVNLFSYGKCLFLIVQ